jgi:hypothetical protein
MRYIKKPDRRLFGSALVFVLSFGVGLYVHDKVTLPFSNPWDIIGLLTLLEYNPSNDIIGFLLLITLPSVVLILCCLNGFTRNLCVWGASSTPEHRDIRNATGALRVFTFLLVFAALFIRAGNTYRVHPLDTFHEGETLGPAIDYLNGKVPYKDSVFIHGAFQDPLRSVLAFRLFGQSIAALRTLGSLLSIVTLVLLFLTLYSLYSKNVYYTTFALIFFLMIQHTRPFGATCYISYIDIPFLVFILVAIQLYKYIRFDPVNINRTKIRILLFLFTFVPTLSFANSVDRGFFLCTAATIYSVAIYLFFLRESDNKSIFPLLGGYVAGIIGTGFAIKWAYYDFFQYVSILFRYEPLMNGLVYPFEDVRFLAPVIFFSLTFYWLTHRFLSYEDSKQRGCLAKVKEFYTEYFMEILLLLLSVFYFRRALGRADAGHLSVVLFPIVILGTYVVIKHYLSPVLARTKGEYRVSSTAALSFLILFLLVLAFNPRANWGKWYKLPTGLPDSAFIPENYSETISFLKKNLGANEQFLTMTSEASWYYFVNKPCPIRFAVIYHAMPKFYQREIVQDLERSNVKFVLYKNSHWSNAVDGFGIEDRLPSVVKYIKDNYVFFNMIDDNEIWIRKS